MSRQRRTPIQQALTDASPLQESVEPGLGAIERRHRRFLADVQAAFADSLDLDASLRRAHEDEPRWDYLLGLAASQQVVALEPHSARSDEVTTVIGKRAAALRQLAGHLRPQARIARWLWVASGKVFFADTERTRRLLDQNGITFVGRRVTRRHLP